MTESDPQDRTPMVVNALQAEEVVRTVARLGERIGERFPDSNLGRVCAEVARIAGQARARARWIATPLVWLRVVTGLVLAFLVLVLVVSVRAVKMPSDALDLTSFVQMVESGINDLILIGACVFFFLTLETRIKRGRALGALHELRALAHIIDMHQLTKDPEWVFGMATEGTTTNKHAGMTPFELRRYLDYCSEMLSLLGKVAALYAQPLADPVVLAAVNEIEDLTTGLARKIWQKIMILSPGER